MNNTEQCPACEGARVDSEGFWCLMGDEFDEAIGEELARAVEQWLDEEVAKGIHYGATDLFGDAVSLDLEIGFKKLGELARQAQARAAASRNATKQCSACEGQVPVRETEEDT